MTTGRAMHAALVDGVRRVEPASSPGSTRRQLGRHPGGRAGGKLLASRGRMLRRALVLATLVSPGLARGDDGLVSAEVRVIGDSRGAAGLGATGALER